MTGAKHGVSPRGEVGEQLVTEQLVPEQQAPVPTPRYDRVLAAAAELAAELQHSYVGVEHLFLAILQDRDAVPTQVLAAFCDLDSVADGLQQVMASPRYRG